MTEIPFKILGELADGDGDEWLVAAVNTFCGTLPVKIQSRGGGFRNGLFVGNSIHTNYQDGSLGISIADEGTRTIINGRGTNDGNPSTGGEFEKRAGTGRKARNGGRASGRGLRAPGKAVTPRGVRR
jgi:hypothetical protein